MVIMLKSEISTILWTKELINFSFTSDTWLLTFDLKKSEKKCSNSDYAKKCETKIVSLNK